MKTRGLRLYGADDIRLEVFDLPPISDNEILADVVSNSICMSDHKAVIQGANHKRVPSDISTHPVLLGHEFCGTIREVGKEYRNRFQPGTKYSIQPALSYPGRELDAPGYSFRYTGGYTDHVLIAQEVLEMDCLLPYDGEGYFKASLSEPVSCIIGAFNGQYHWKAGTYRHDMGIIEGGSCAILAGAGPMGLGAVDYALHGPRKPRLLVVTDVDQSRLNRAAEIFSPAHAKTLNVSLHYLNTRGENPVAMVKQLNDDNGFDDVFVFAPVASLIEQGSCLLGFNGCLNFFAGPAKQDFTAAINFYDIHYSGHHVVGTSGGNTDDMRQGLDLMAAGKLDPAVMITHIGGIDSAPDTIARLPSIPGGKKLIYTTISMPLTALDDLGELGNKEPFFAELAKRVDKHNGLWSVESEEYLLAHASSLNEQGCS